MTDSPSLSSSVQTSWRPVLQGDEAQRAHAVAQALGHDVLDHPSLEGMSLAGGWAGVTLFYDALHQAFPEQGWSQARDRALDQAVEALAAGVTGAAFYGGFTGLAWVMDRLAEDPYGEDPAEEIDQALVSHLDRLIRDDGIEDYDLISGLVGYGVYALGRAHRPLAQQILDRVVTRLHQTHRKVGKGISWHTSPRLLPPWQLVEHPEGYFNLGLAHGVPGVLSLLGRMSMAGLGDERVRFMLEEGFQWFHACATASGEQGFLASMVGDADESGAAEGGRVAWCYGDLGAAIACVTAARALGRADAEAWALGRAKRMAQLPLMHWGIRDGGLCHGAAGNMHLFNRLWQATGEEVFLKAALESHEALFALRKEGEAVGGWPSFAPTDENPQLWRPVAGLLEGASGVGLALLALSQPHLPKWDGLLMVDL